MMMRRRRAHSAVAIAAGAAVLATVPLFIHHAPAPRDVRARVVRAAAAWSAAAPPQLAPSAGGKTPRDAPDPEAEAAALPRGTIVAVHGDARVATQRRLLARLGGAAGLTRATENALDFEAFDAHLAKAARARRGRLGRAAEPEPDGVRAAGADVRDEHAQGLQRLRRRRASRARALSAPA